jgi:hypothetical protein
VDANEKAYSLDPVFEVGVMQTGLVGCSEDQQLSSG